MILLAIHERRRPRIPDYCIIITSKYFIPWQNLQVCLCSRCNNARKARPWAEKRSVSRIGPPHSGHCIKSLDLEDVNNHNHTKSTNLGSKELHSIGPRPIALDFNSGNSGKTLSFDNTIREQLERKASRCHGPCY